MGIFHIGLALYAFNLLVGLAAWHWRIHFGWFHHFLYALVFLSTVAATIFRFHPALLVTVACLAGLPSTRPRSFWHPALAIVGFLGYVLAVLTPWGAFL
jgi:hypothetical protein